MFLNSLFSFKILIFIQKMNKKNQSESEKHRWGVKCTIHGINFHTLPYLFDIKLTLTSLTKSVLESLISGSKPTADELFLLPWLRTLLSSGISAKHISKHPALYAFISDGQEMPFLKRTYDSVEYDWLCGTGNKKVADTANWAKSIRALTLALLKHSGILKQIVRADVSSSAEKKILKSVVSRCKSCVLVAKQLQLWMYENAQILNTWNGLWRDGAFLSGSESLEDVQRRDGDFRERFFEEYKKNAGPELVETLCHLKGVEFNQKNVDESIESLFELAKKERGDTKVINGFEQVLCLLLSWVL